jgi:hypothetical protein
MQAQVVVKWRRGADSNPRYLAARRFSRPVHSTTLTPLRKVIHIIEDSYPIFQAVFDKSLKKRAKTI